MQIGELFVSIGLKGADKTLNSLVQVKSQMTNIRDSSLAMKAALIAAMYTLEKLISASGTRGTELANFESLTGISAVELQKWQYAARQVGATNEDVAGSFKNIQNVINGIKIGNAVPKWFAQFAQATQFDLEKAENGAEGILYTMQKLNEITKSNIPIDTQNAILKDWISEGTISAMRQGAFSQRNLNAAPTYNESQLRQLQRNKAMWGNLGTEIEMMFGKFNSKHGGDLIKDIEKITSSVLKLAGALQTLFEKFKLFDALDKIVDSVKSGLENIGYVFDLFNAKDEKDRDKITDNYKKSHKSEINDYVNSAKKMQQDMAPNSEILKKIFDISNWKSIYQEDSAQKNIIPDMKNKPTGNNNIQNNTINQSLNFQHEGKDAAMIQDSVSKANIAYAYKLSSAQGRLT
jgi:hypothetical protein